MVVVNEKDVREVAFWLECDANLVEITPAWIPIGDMRRTIDCILDAYRLFPEEQAITAQFAQLIESGAAMQPVFIKLGDDDRFIVQGKHRVVAFANAGLSHVPVAFVSRSNEPVADLAAHLSSLSWPARPRQPQ